MSMHIVAIRDDPPFIQPVILTFDTLRWIVWPLPWKVNREVRNVEKKRLVAMLLDEVDAVLC